MPRILKRDLLQRLQALPQFQSFVEDFRTLTDLDLILLDEFGSQLSAEVPRGRLCHALLETSGCAGFCSRTRQRFLAGNPENAATHRCAAGLYEITIPLRMSGQMVGFFVIGVFRRGPIPPGDLQKFTHRLAQSGVSLHLPQIGELLDSSPVVSSEAADALARIVTTMARHFDLLASDHFLDDQKPMPALAHRARRYIRAHGLNGRCPMDDIARACGVSPAHLSRVFHHSIGLTISEYLARFRIEHVLKHLKNRRQSITQIAFASGFQSLSQFNRTFKSIVGCSPTRFESGMRTGGLMPPARYVESKA